MTFPIILLYKCTITVGFLHTKQHICYCALMLSQFRPSVTRVDQSKMVEVRIVHFSPYSSPIPLVFVR